MAAKLLLFAAILLFGALMFAAGVLAPDTLRQDAQHWVTQRLGGSATPGAASSTAPQSASAQPAAQANASGDKPIPYDTLLLPPVANKSDRYALQLGLVSDDATAKALAQRAEAAGYATRNIAVLDKNDLRWVAVAVGDYADADSARAARVVVGAKLGVSSTLGVIKLPPAPAAAPEAPAPAASGNSP